MVGSETLEYGRIIESGYIRVVIPYCNKVYKCVIWQTVLYFDLSTRRCDVIIVEYNRPRWTGRGNMHQESKGGLR